MAPSAAVMRVTAATVETAVNALLKYKAAKSAGQKPQLLPEDDYIYLNLTLKKIPSNTRKTPFQIPLRHPILDDNSEVCLIIDDKPGTPTPPSDEIKKLVKSQNIPISKVLKISKLKSNYKSYEERRKLCGSYELFLVDKMVIHLLPRLIGKEFFKKKKLPLGLDFRKKNLKSQVERALGSGLFYMRTGTCCVMKVGKVAMGQEEIVENVMDAIKGAVDLVPKKWDGVRSLHLKFYDSVALPLYQVIPDMKLKIEGAKEVEKIDDDAKEERSKNSECKEKVAVSKDVRISKKKKKKGRIHEVHYMDEEDDPKGDDLDLSGNEPENSDGMMELKGDKSNLSDQSADDEAEIHDTEEKETVVELPRTDEHVKKRKKGTSIEPNNPEEDGISGEDAPGSKKGKRKSGLGEKPSKKKAKSKEVSHKRF